MELIQKIQKLLYIATFVFFMKKNIIFLLDVICRISVYKDESDKNIYKKIKNNLKKW